MKTPTLCPAPPTLAEIEPGTLYPLGAFVALVPSCRRGKRLDLKTVYRWIAMGYLRAQRRRTSHARPSWFVAGSEIIRYARPDGPPVKDRSESRRRRDVDAANAQLRKLGAKV